MVGIGPDEDVADRRDLQLRALGASRPAGIRRPGPAPGGGLVGGNLSALSATGLAGVIDHTILGPEKTAADVRRVVREAREAGCASACVNARFAPLAVRELAGSPTVACVTVGFPLGAMPSEAKAFEAAWARDQGAREIDMVLPVGAVREADDHAVWADVRAVRDAIGEETVLKVILETGLLSDPEKVLAAQIAVAAGADFVKTSTGFGPGGATVEDVHLIRRAVGPEVGIKASGGIGSYTDAIRLLEAGADRLGMSRTLKVLAEAAHGRSGEPS